MAAPPSQIRPDAGPARHDQPREAAGWTAGRIIAVVAGSILALVSLALLAAGVTVTWGRPQPASGRLPDISHRHLLGQRLRAGQRHGGAARMAWLARVVRRAGADPGHRHRPGETRLRSHRARLRRAETTCPVWPIRPFHCPATGAPRPPIPAPLFPRRLSRPGSGPPRPQVRVPRPWYGRPAMVTGWPSP